MIRIIINKIDFSVTISTDLSGWQEQLRYAAKLCLMILLQCLSNLF